MSDIQYSCSALIATTTRGLAMPVFYDPHTQIFNNKPPGTLITGGPGSGKTYLGLTLAAISTIMGKTTVVLDPKGDFLSLLNIKEDIGSFELWNLLDGRNKGILDPFNMADNLGDTLSLVMTTIELFCGGLTPEQTTVLSPIVQDVIKEPNPSLTRVMDKLRSSKRSAAFDLGTKLDIISKMNFAKLCFSPGSRSNKKVSLSGGLTVISLLGMELPESAEDALRTNEGRLASGVFFLITDFIRRVMRDDTSDKPKTLIIDETWVVAATEAGASVIKKVGLLGRSKNLAMILLTQSPSHLKNLDVDSTIRTRFAFSAVKKDALKTIADMDLPQNEGFEETLTQFDTGECLMQDWQGNYSTIQIANWKKDWVNAFRTNPFEKARAKRDAQAKEQKD